MCFNSARHSRIRTLLRPVRMQSRHDSLGTVVEKEPHSLDSVAWRRRRCRSDELAGFRRRTAQSPPPETGNRKTSSDTHSQAAASFSLERYFSHLKTRETWLPTDTAVARAIARSCRGSGGAKPGWFACDDEIETRVLGKRPSVSASR